MIGEKTHTLSFQQKADCSKAIKSEAIEEEEAYQGQKRSNQEETTSDSQ